MPLLRSLFCGLLLLATATATVGRSQALPAPPAAPTNPDAAPPQKLLLKVGLNAGRALRWSGYYGLAASLPLSVGAEYYLSPKFTLYGQLDSDIRVLLPNAGYGDQTFAVPTGALGVGARYYYNQAGRIQHNRPHGPFVGNYLAIEAHTEVRRYYGTSTEVAPGLNLIWGMQRRLSRNFLFDFNTGVGLGPYNNNTGFGYHAPSSLNITTQFNLGIYFGR